VVALALVGLISGFAVADVYQGVDYDIVDKIDTWSHLGGNADIVPITEWQSLKYQHDLTAYGVPSAKHVTAAWLELDFTNDRTDRFGFVEHVTVGAYDSTTDTWTQFASLGEVDAGQYDMALVTNWLNDDGILDIELTVLNKSLNPLETAWLDHSVLCANVQAVTTPVPGAALLGLLGLSFAGVKLRKHV
jgi:hypothetical protein